MISAKELVRRINVEDIQEEMNQRVREELEKYHELTILPYGILFSHKPEEVTYEMVRDTLREKLKDQSVVPQRIDISKALLFEHVDPEVGQALDEAQHPITFVHVWYYLPEKEN